MPLLRLVLILAIASLAILPLAPVQAKPRSAPESARDRELVVLGDSLAVGWGAFEPKQTGFAGRLAGLLAAATGAQVQLLNLGVAGESSASFIGDYFENLNSRSQLARAVQTLQARASERSPIVVVEVGGNDLLALGGRMENGSERALALERFAENFDRILGELRDAAGEDAMLVTMTYYDPLRLRVDLRWLGRLNQAIVDASARHEVRVARVYERFVGLEMLYTWAIFGDIHPTDRGHEAIALALLEALELEQPSPAREWVEVAGQVVEVGSGRPIVGAEVYFGGGTAFTGADGRFIFPRVFAIDVPITFGAAAHGYESGALASVMPRAAKVPQIKLHLEPTQVP